MKLKRPFSVAEMKLLDSEWELQHPGGSFAIEFRADGYNHCAPPTPHPLMAHAPPADGTCHPLMLAQSSATTSPRTRTGGWTMPRPPRRPCTSTGASLANMSCCCRRTVRAWLGPQRASRTTGARRGGSRRWATWRRPTCTTTEQAASRRQERGTQSQTDEISTWTVRVTCAVCAVYV